MFAGCFGGALFTPRLACVCGFFGGFVPLPHRDDRKAYHRAQKCVFVTFESSKIRGFMGFR